MWVVVPVKSFALAKQRLAPVLAAEQRQWLVRAMLMDVLGAIASASHVAGVTIVSSEPAAERIASSYGADFLPDLKVGLSSAIAQAAQTMTARRRASMLVLPADVPLVTSTEIDALIDYHGEQGGVTIVSDRDRDGTNAMAVTPPHAMDYQFGTKSFARHRAIALERGLFVDELEFPGLALDIDTPEDLRHLMTYEEETATLAYLSDANLAHLLLSHQDRQPPQPSFQTPP